MSTERAIRQLLRTDQLLGIDWVPVSDAVFESPESPAPTVETASLGSGDARVPGSPRSTSTQLRPTPQPTLIREEGPAITRDSRTADQRAAELDALKTEVTAWIESDWPRDGWQNVVFGEGRPDAEIMFIGEGPGADEDDQGRPFVGRAGQLLEKQITAMGLKREDVYIANIAKTRPPGNRVPTPDEAEHWLPWLEKQIEIIQPTAIVTLGATSAKYLLGNPKLAITRERGNWKSFRGIDLMPTFHPAYLLRQYTVDNRRRVWDDLKKVLEHVGLPVPGEE